MLSKPCRIWEHFGTCCRNHVAFEGILEHVVETMSHLKAFWNMLSNENIMYNKTIILKSATVPSGTRSVSDPPLLLSQIFLDLEPSVLLFGAVSSSVLRTQQVQPLITTVTRFRTILHFFSEAPFLQRSVPKRLPSEPPKHPKNSKIGKKPGLWTHLRPSYAKRLRLEGVKL